MNTQLVVGTIFCSVVVLWLMAFVTLTTILNKPIRIHLEQYRLIQFICAMGAGFGGLMFASGLIVNLGGKLDAYLDFTAKGGGAAAAFLIVWVTFPKPSEVASKPGNLVKTEIPGGWTFHQAVKHIAELWEATPKFDGFRDTELGAVLENGFLVQGATGEETIKQVSKFAPKVRPFDVVFDKSSHEYTLRPRAT